MDTPSFYGKRKQQNVDSNSDLSENYSDISNSDGSDDDYAPDDDISSTDSDTSDFSSDSTDTQDENDGNQGDGSNQPQRKKRRVVKNQSFAQNPYLWKDNPTATSPFSFSGNSGLLKRIIHDDQSENTLPIEIFNQFFDDSIMEIIVTETNRYAQQIVSSRQIRRSSRMNRWKDITKEEMETFLGIILVTGLIKYPKMEDYWSLDPIYYHPLFHQIGMSYNRFSLILKNWHVANNLEAEEGDRLHKIANFALLFTSNIKAVYLPAGEISVDETQIARRGRLSFRQYNPGKANKYGIKPFKLAEMTGYVWDFSIYCGNGKEIKIDGLDHSGSIVVSLAEPLLNEGRLLVADNWYSSIALAKYLCERNTEYCGTMRPNRKHVPIAVKDAKLKKEETISAVNQDGIRIMNYKDKKNVLMVSTFHGSDLKCTGKKNCAGNDILKPAVILDYNRVKGGIDLSDQMISYYSPARKSVKWYRKILFQCISIAVLNSWVLYNRFYAPQKNMTLASFIKSIASSLLVIDFIAIDFN